MMAISDSITPSSAQPVEAAQAGGRREPDLFGQLLRRAARIDLNQLQKPDVEGVERGRASLHDAIARLARADFSRISKDVAKIAHTLKASIEIAARRQRMLPAAKLECKDMAAGLLASKRAFITGGAKGIGLAVAAAFLHEGARVTIADNDGGALERAVDQLSALAPDQVNGLALDIADADGTEAIADKLFEAGGIDVVVPNAGIIVLERALKLD